MVSKLYRVKDFYEKQKKKEIGTNVPRIEKIFKSKNGKYFIYDKDKKGKYHRVYLSKEDLVYSRQGRVSKYDIKRDEKIIADKTFTNESVWKRKVNQGDRYGLNV